MEPAGQLQLTGAVVTGIELRSLDTCLDYIAISLESGEFVALLGTNRIRLVFSGCVQTGFDLRAFGGQDTLHSFYVKENRPEPGFVHYCVEMNMSGSTLDIIARGVQVEVSKSTHRQH